jgi:hypothetical protein
VREATQKQPGNPRDLSTFIGSHVEERHGVGDELSPAHVVLHSTPHEVAGLRAPCCNREEKQKEYIHPEDIIGWPRSHKKSLNRREWGAESSPRMRCNSVYLGEIFESLVIVSEQCRACIIVRQLP